MSKIVKLSERVLPGGEIQPWIYEEILKMETLINVLQKNEGKVTEVYNAGFKLGYNQGTYDADMKNQSTVTIEASNAIYQSGYNAGYNDGQREAVGTAAYENGYNDATYDYTLKQQPDTVADGEARFKLEEQIMDVWRITSELNVLSEYVIESGDSAIAKQDKVSNMLIGLEQLYEIKFDNLWRQFEKMIHDRQIV